MSKELKWCKNFVKVCNLFEHHKRKKTRVKNLHRRSRMMNQALDRWGGFPYPKEWQKVEEV